MARLVELCVKLLGWLMCPGFVYLLDPNFRILIIYYFLKFFARLNDFKDSLDFLIKRKEDFPEKISLIVELEKQMIKMQLILNSKMLNKIIKNLLHSDETFMSNEQGSLEFIDIFCVFVFLYLKINTPIYNQTHRNVEHFKDFFRSRD